MSLDLDAGVIMEAMQHWFVSSAIIAVIAMAVIVALAAAPPAWLRRWRPMSVGREGDVLDLIASDPQESPSIHCLTPGQRLRVQALIHASSSDPKWMVLCLHRWLRDDLALLVMIAQHLPTSTLSALATHFRAVMAPLASFSQQGLHVGVLAALLTGVTGFLAFFIWPKFLQIARELEIPVAAIPWPIRWDQTPVVMGCALLAITVAINVWYQHRWRASGMRLLRAHLVALACRERCDETTMLHALDPAATGPASWAQVLMALRLPAVTPDALPRLIEAMTRQRVRRARQLHLLAAMLVPVIFGVLVGVNCWALWRFLTLLLETQGGQADGQ